jgi:hypothetical protein
MPIAALQHQISGDTLRRLISEDRLSTYVARCDGRFDDAIALYRWNARASSAFWEPLGHLEVALRNTLSWRLELRHARLERPGSWLDDPASDLSPRGRQSRIRSRGCTTSATASPTISGSGTTTSQRGTRI